MCANFALSALDGKIIASFQPLLRKQSLQNSANITTSQMASSLHV